MRYHQVINCAALITVICLLLFGCADEPIKIEVGQEAQEAIALLDQHAIDISCGVGILASPGEAHWFSLRDGTCVELWVLSDDDGVTRVGSILLGEEGKGYIGKSGWGEQDKRAVDTLVLEE
ncbi:MAG: hypothetical protein AAGB26_12400 [Planctomycetota bacterium]